MANNASTVSHTFSLQVMSINGIFFEGRCRKVIVPCIDGQMAFEAHHEEMFLAIYNGTMKIQKEDGSWIEAVVGVGSAQFANNRCTILAYTAERPEDIDVHRAQEALENAKEKIRQQNSIKEYRMSQAAMARALSRLDAASKYNLHS